MARLEVETYLKKLKKFFDNGRFFSSGDCEPDAVYPELALATGYLCRVIEELTSIGFPREKEVDPEKRKEFYFEQIENCLK